ncbi:MAG: hypothetical protein LC104_06115 [Bacteroidales bacterium]|nr:hypothetical protein [Bacteroidales bacterium]
MLERSILRKIRKGRHCLPGHLGRKGQPCIVYNSISNRDPSIAIHKVAHLWIACLFSLIVCVPPLQATEWPACQRDSDCTQGVSCNGRECVPVARIVGETDGDERYIRTYDSIGRKILEQRIVGEVDSRENGETDDDIIRYTYRYADDPLVSDDPIIDALGHTVRVNGTLITDPETTTNSGATDSQTPPHSKFRIVALATLFILVGLWLAISRKRRRAHLNRR